LAREIRGGVGDGVWGRRGGGGLDNINMLCCTFGSN
jgi:hypothetical protein